MQLALFDIQDETLVQSNCSNTEVLITRIGFADCLELFYWLRGFNLFDFFLCDLFFLWF